MVIIQYMIEIFSLFLLEKALPALSEVVMKKISFFVLTVFLLLLLIPAFASVEANVTEKNVWLRDKDSNIIDEIPIGTQIDVEDYDINRGMFFVSYENKKGYIKGTGLNIPKDSLKIQVFSSFSSSSNNASTLNAQAAYNLAQKSYVHYESKNGRLLNCDSSYIQGDSFSMKYYVFNSRGFNGHTCETQFLLSFNDKTTAYDISPSFQIHFVVPQDSEPNMIVMTTNGNSITIPSSLWRWVSGSIDIDFSEHLDWIRQLVSYGGAFAWSNIDPSSLNGVDMVKTTMEYKALKATWDVWQEAGLDNFFTNTAKVTAPPTTTPTAKSVIESSSTSTSSLDINAVSVGSTILLGHYEQDNIIANGEESIEWKVLSVEDDKALIISAYGLDTMAYGTTSLSMKEGFSWATADVRTWLNSSFYNTAFSQSEKNRIIYSQVSTDDAFGKFTTNDRLFVLSIAEVNKYFSSSSAMSCQATEYAKEKLTMPNTNGTTAKDEKYATWWLRDLVSVYKSKGFDSTFNIAALVWANTGITTDTNTGWPFLDNAIVVRPAMWIKLDNDMIQASNTSQVHVPTQIYEEFDLDILQGSPYYTYDQFSNHWSVQSCYKKDYGRIELSIYLILFDSYLQNGLGPELRVCLYNKEESFYYSIPEFRVAVGHTLYRFEKLLSFDGNNSIFACNTLMELCKAFENGQEIVFQYTYVDSAGKSYTNPVLLVNNVDVKDLISLASTLNRSNIWNAMSNLEISDVIYGASIY